MSEQAMMTDPRAIMQFFLAGRAIFTIRSAQSGAHFTYKVSEADKRSPDEVPKYFVNLLAGPDNMTDYKYLGLIVGGMFRLTDKSRKNGFSDKTPSIVAISFALNCVRLGRIPASLEIWHEGRCGRCGRRLTVPESIATGLGPECAEKGFGSASLPVVPKAAEGFVYRAPQKSESVAAVQQRVSVSDFRQTVRSFARKVQPAASTPLNGETLRKTASRMRDVSEAEVAAAVADYKANNPDLYYQDGELDEGEAHAVAVMKFRHDLAKQ